MKCLYKHIYRLKYAGVLLASVLYLAVLVGCKCKPPQSMDIAPPPCHTYTHCQLAHLQRGQYQNILYNQHIMVATIGETVRVILPDDSIFAPYSANLQADQQTKLNTLAQLIRSYDIVSVDVAAYSDDQFPGFQAQALTTKQALVVAEYLRRQQIDARLITAKGYGQQNMVATNLTSEGRAYNRRVEVTFQVYPPEPLY